LQKDAVAEKLIPRTTRFCDWLYDAAAE